LRHVLLQSEEELLSKKSSELIGGVVVPKPKKIIGKIKVQGIIWIFFDVSHVIVDFISLSLIIVNLLSCIVRKVKMGLDAPSGCIFPHLSKLELEAVQYRISNVKSRLSSGWEAVQKVQVACNIPKNGSLSSKSLAYVHIGTRYMKEIASVLRSGLTSQATTSSSCEVVQGMLFCFLIFMNIN